MSTLLRQIEGAVAPLLAFALAACAAWGEEERLRQAEVSQIKSQGVSLVVDACIYRQSPPFEADYYLKTDSLRAAEAMSKATQAFLAEHKLQVPHAAIPFVCGSLAWKPTTFTWKPSASPKFAERIGQPAAAVKDLPPPASADTQPGAASREAYLLLIKVASEMTQEPRPSRSKEDFNAAARGALRRSLGTSNVLVIVGRGASIARGQKVTDAVLETFLGGGCTLGEGDCDPASTDSDGIRADAVLLDLDNNRVAWSGRPSNIAGPGLWADHDPLHPAIYANRDWLDKLLRTFPAFAD